MPGLELLSQNKRSLNMQPLVTLRPVAFISLSYSLFSPSTPSISMLGDFQVKLGQVTAKVFDIWKDRTLKTVSGDSVGYVPASMQEPPPLPPPTG